MIPILYEGALNHIEVQEIRKRNEPHSRSVSSEKDTKKEVKRVWRSLTKKWYDLYDLTGLVTYIAVVTQIRTVLIAQSFETTGF
ncbi:hypothetical protein CDG76_20410 [Nostoc sp. 'Peltigera membranacea cyanobiont' 210A]|nr:hypothetical protein CDG76_20410 [Nostoc sp. 'Peltigera membranacea cyanobiont' 210A]